MVLFRPTAVSCLVTTLEMERNQPLTCAGKLPANFERSLIDSSKCQILLGLKSLSTSELKNLHKRCAKKYKRFRKRLTKIRKQQRSEGTIEMQQEKYRTNVFDLLKRDLALTFEISDLDSLCSEFAKILIYYLGHRLQPTKLEENLIRRLNNPNATIEINFWDYSWNAVCCELLNMEHTFKHLYICLGNEPLALCYFFRNSPNLLFKNRWLNSLLRKIKACVPVGWCRQIFSEVRNENGQTLFFDHHVDADFWKIIYEKRPSDLYAVLTIKNQSLQTSLHCNTEIIAKLLATFYNPKRATKLVEILNFRDSGGHTPLDVVTGIMRAKLVWLKEQAESNRYILYDALEVIIAYTRIRRENSDEEASSIHKAFEKLTPRENITFQNTFKYERITQLIREKATQKPAALLVILMAHGQVGTIYDCDGKEVRIGDIEEAMCSNPELKDKPKVLIIQCCQARDDLSKRINADSERSGSLRAAGRNRVDAKPSSLNKTPFVPRNPNFCAITACMPGESADRNLFIPILADLLQKAGPNANIIQLVQSAGAKMNSVGKEQTPLVVSTLKADFNPKAGFYSQWNM